jgi:D-aminopeptidase
LVFALLLASAIMAQSPTGSDLVSERRPRPAELGLTFGVLPRGPLNSINDVKGVRVGHSTITRERDLRTGVTAILPHTGNLFQQKVPAAIFVGNGFGKLAGSTQVNELGEIETPILLTSTLSVPKTAEFLIDYMLGLPGNENVRSINPVVAETNDGGLNDIRRRAITRDDVFNAIRSATDGLFQTGSVGAGTGTIAFGWKGGIGTASRKLPAALGGYTLGVLVQTNFGGVLSIDGVPVGKELGQYYLKGTASQAKAGAPADSPDGSIIIVIATDAPLDHRQLSRMASRSMSGLARTGSSMSNGSGDYAIAFSTQNPVNAGDLKRSVTVLGNDAMSPLFEAVIEATEEAIIDSLFAATTTAGFGGRRVEALPIDKVRGVLERYGRL